MINSKRYYKEEQRYKLEMSVAVQKNCYRNKSDKPYPSDLYPIAVHFWAKENDENLKFYGEVENWCKKKGNRICKFREVFTNSHNRLSYEIYFDTLETFRIFLLNFLSKYEVQEEITPFTSALKNPINILPEFLLQKAHFIFKALN